TLVPHRVNLHLGELLRPLQVLHIVAPQPGLRFEVQAAEGRTVSTGVRFLAVNVGRQPHARLKVEAPAVEMQIIAITGTWRVGAIETDNVEVAVLHPYSSGEQALGRTFFRLHVNHDATHFSQELLAN